MRKVKIHIAICFAIMAIITNSCVEPYTIEESTFDNALVIQATITNELKYHEIIISNTTPLEDTNFSPEQNASVKIIDDTQNTYIFQEITPGKYLSISEFKALPNINYTLVVTTNKGKSYTTQPVQLTTSTKIDDVYASKEIDELGNENISILVNSFDPTNKSKYYRYEYEETYKIIAPKWNAYDLVVTSNTYPFRIEKVLKTREEQICYNTVNSNTIIQKETNGLAEDRVLKFPVRVLSKDNTIISHRYSILVKQYVQSPEAFTFYKTLSKISGSESVFSQNQPGFFNGNIYSVENQNENVLGFFEVSSVTTKRMYFNYRDFFPDDALPPYFTTCEPFAPSNAIWAEDPSDLINAINSGTVKFYEDNAAPDFSNPGPYFVVIPECGDCNKFGTNIKPDFWVE